MLRAILSKCWKQNSTKQQLYDYSPPISQTIHVKRTRHVELCWEVRTESSMTLSNGPLHMDTPVLADQQSFATALCKYQMQSTSQG